MPELEYAVLCQFAHVDPGHTGHVIGAGIDTLQMNAVPAGVNLGLLLRFTFTQNECERPHRAEIFVQNADGERLVALASPLLADWPADTPPHWRSNRMIGAELRCANPGLRRVCHSDHAQ